MPPRCAESTTCANATQTIVFPAHARTSCRLRHSSRVDHCCHLRILDALPQRLASRGWSRRANHPGFAAAVSADPGDDSKRTIAGLIALFGNQPNHDAREPPSSPPRRRDNLSGKPEDPDRTVQATLAMGPLPARRLPACHHRSRKVGSCGRIAGALLRVRRYRSKGSSAGVLSAYQSPDLRSVIAGLRV